MPETQKEPIFEATKQRKLTEDDNYILMHYNRWIQGYTSFNNEYRTKVTKILVNDQELQNTHSFDLPNLYGNDMKISFSEPVDSLEHFFERNFYTKYFMLIQ